MQEELKKVTGTTIEPAERSVTLCVRSKRIHLNGIWNWQMQSLLVYCSDVMSFPDEFEGTKALIHPDDFSKLMAALSLMEEKEVPRLDFRIITTYGEVKTITGQRVSIDNEKEKFDDFFPGKEPWEEVLQQLILRKENDFLQLRRELSEHTERLHNIGSWLMSKELGQAWYSDNVYRIHGLAPQSLNAHANTFNQFIHPDDRVSVQDAFERAYRDEVSLHVEYRILSPNGEVRYVQQITKWMYDNNGRVVFCGIMRDITEERAIVDELVKAQSFTLLNQHVLKFAEQQSAIGYWYVDLTTRKASYSDNYHRIYGLKPGTLPTNSFLNLVHTEDRARVSESIDKMYKEHVLAETEYRIIRPDGKTRHLKQNGKLFINPEKQLVMIGIVQDISVQKSLEKKIQELNETVTLNRLVAEMAEASADVSSIVWLPDGYMQWSDGFYYLLGHKPGGVEPLSRILQKNIHPADVKAFREAETLILNGQEHDDLIVRIISRAGTRQIKISFRQLSFEKDKTGTRVVAGVVHDITKQVALQDAFTQSKLFTNLLADAVNDVIIFTNTDNIILSWNAVAEEKTGISKGDALHNNLFDALPTLNEENFLGQLHFALSGNETQSLRATNAYFKKAHDYWLCPLKNEKEEMIGVLHVVQDVSEQLALQQQLSERLNFIESLIEASVDRIVVLDRFMNYLYWNKKAEDYYGINKQRVLGKNILEVFPSFQNNPGYQQFRKVLKGETVYLPPVISEDSDEYFETYLIPIKDGDGNITAVLWIVHDLGREYQLTKERTQTANLLQATMDAATDMIQVFEAVRDEDGEIIDFKYVLLNHEAEKWMPGAVGKSLLELQPQVMEEGIFDAFKQVTETGISRQYEKHYVHEQFNGWFYQSVVKLNDGVATTTTDITERKKAQEELLRLKDEVTQQATDKYYSIFNAIDEGFCIYEVIHDNSGKPVDLRWVEVNPAYEKHTGLKDVVGKTHSEISMATEQYWFDIYDHVAKTGETADFENWHEPTNRWYRVFNSRIGGSGSNQVAVIFEDITGRKRREQQQAFLLRFSDNLRAERTADAIANRALEMLIEYLRLDRSYIISYYLDKNIALLDYQIGNETVPPLPNTFELSHYPEAYRAILDQTLVIDDDFERQGLSETEKQNSAQLGMRAMVAATVRKGENKPLWSMVAINSKPRHWTPDEVQLVEEIAERTWAAVERAKAEQALQHFNESLENLVATATKELKHNKDLLQSVFDASLQGIILFHVIRNENGLIQDYEVVLNNAITQKWNGRDLTGKLYSEEFPAIKKHGIIEAFNEVIQTGETSKLEVKYEGEGFKNWFIITAIKLSEDELLSTAEDITERKNAEEELRKNLTILQHTEEMAQSGSWEYETTTGNFTWSGGMYKLFGLPKQMKVRPETYLDFATEEDRSVAKRIVNHLKKEHQSFEERIRITRGNDERLLVVKASLVKDDKGAIQKVIGVDIDITDIQKAEEKLKESRHWLEQTAKSSPDAIMVYDLKNRQPTLLNNCLGEWLGISNKNLVEMGVEGRLKLVHPDDRLKLLHFTGKAREAIDNEIITLEYRVLTERKEVIWLRNRTKVFQRDAHGNATHLLSILQNVTEEITLRNELKRRIQFAETILDNSTNRITVFDRDYKFIAWNKRCEEIHGVTRDKVIGKTIFELFPGVEKHPVFMDAQERSLKGEYVHVPFVQDGYTGAYLELFYVPLANESGDTYAVLNIMHDVSKFVKNTEELDALNKKLETKNIELEQKNDEITSFAFVASHDMKEPLRKIRTFSDWLMEQESEQLSAKGKNLVEKINSSVHRMEILIEDILVLTKIHSDPHKEENVDLNKILQQVVDDMQEEISQTSTIIQADKLPVIKANANQLFYLFKNLISNAIKFQKPGSVPKLTIGSDVVKGSELKINEPKEEYLKVSFADNGFGFDQKYARKIFQVFQRLHGKHEYEGTGIGLAICKKIMENHNGLINVISEAGKGSVFNCFFPLH